MMAAILITLLLSYWTKVLTLYEMKVKNIDGQQFHQYYQNEELPLTLNH